jgi:hypothetical protein
MQENDLKIALDAPPSDSQAADNQPKRTRTMSEAALAANRANALKSTGPRTAAGKLKAASNSLKHGLYSVRNFDDFIDDHNVALDVVTNFVEQFNPITPTEVALVHQLIQMQIRFLQVQYLYGKAMRFRVDDILTKPVPLLAALMRELDRLPVRIQRTIKVLREEIKLRDSQLETCEIEPIPDNEPLPPRPPHEIYYGDQPGDYKGPQAQTSSKTNPNQNVETVRQIVLDFIDKLKAKHDQYGGPPPTPDGTSQISE